MGSLISEAGRSFLRAFLVVFVPLAAGLLNAPNLQAALALSIAALAASIAAGLKAVQSFVPQLTLAQYIPAPYGAPLDSFVRTFLGTFLVFATGWLGAPDWSTWKAALLGGFTGALGAGLRALQGFLDPNDWPAKGSGFTVPGTPVKPPVESPAS